MNAKLSARTPLEGTALRRNSVSETTSETTSERQWHEARLFLSSKGLPK